MVTALAIVVLVVVTAASFRLSWGAHNLPFAALFLLVGLITGSTILVVCAVAIALLSAAMMTVRRRRGRPAWRD